MGEFKMSSTMLTLGNSRPMTGVVSSNANPSRVPVFFSGAGYADSGVTTFPLCEGSVSVGASDKILGAMMTR